MCYFRALKYLHKMVAFFIIPVSLTLSEAIMILLVVLIIYYRHKIPGIVYNLCKGIEQLWKNNK